MFFRSHIHVCAVVLASLCTQILSCSDSKPTLQNEVPDASSPSQDDANSSSPDSTPPPLSPPTRTLTASALNRTVATDIARATEFLYKGKDAVQVGVAEGTLERKRVAVLRGTVRSREGTLLSGVKVTILSHPEFGFTETRSDGQFDMAVNGGGPLTITYSKDGYITAQRQVQTPWRDYVVAPEVVMVAYDANVTEVKLNAITSIETARGSVVEDNDGKRQATLMVLPGTKAAMSTGTSTQSLDTLHIRATEYTIGKDGPHAMPATLPPTSGYTYAVELSADEAEKAGASKVEFSQPMYFYVENFLKFPVGGIVPVGFYDRDKGQWIASKNGKIVKILSVSNAKANVDVDGDDKADEGETLTKLGFSDEERQRLATMYQPGQSLWRVPITHFTPWDCNWPYGPPKDATPPNQPEPKGDELLDKPYCRAGSIIECQNQVLGVEIPVAGTPFSLRYQSERVVGRKLANTMNISLSGSSIPSGLKRIELKIYVAGREFSLSFWPSTNRSYIFTWDGIDIYGRKVQGKQPISIHIGYVYDAIYLTPPELAQAFGAVSASGAEITADRSRNEITLWQSSISTIGAFDATEQGLGGWQLNSHHVYVPNEQRLYRGDGWRQSANSSSTSSVNTVAGTGTLGFGGDNGPASNAQMGFPQDLAIGPDGSMFFVDSSNNRIRKIKPDGSIVTIAGDGTKGFSGDGGPATSARFHDLRNIALGPDGSLYIADSNNNRIRRITPNGQIDTIVGSDYRGYWGDNGPVTEARINGPEAIAIGSDGSLFIYDAGNRRIRQVTTDGKITTIAGGGTKIPQDAEGGSAKDIKLSSITDLMVTPDGNLYIADQGFACIQRIGPDGIIRRIAGTCDDIGGRILNRMRMAAGRNGILYISQSYTLQPGETIHALTPKGVLVQIAGVDSRGYGGDGGNPLQANFDLIDGIALANDGTLYVTDRNNHRIRRIDSSLPDVLLGSQLIPSDDGREVYMFDDAGRHTATRDALTGVLRHRFTYNAGGLLTSVVDVDGNTTTIERDGNGKAIGILGPYGQHTSFMMDSNGYLAHIRDPASRWTALTYTSDGLLTSLTDPGGGMHRFTYDLVGNLIKDENPGGGLSALTRTDEKDSYQVSIHSALGRTVNHQVAKDTTNGITLTDSLPDGTKHIERRNPDATRTNTHSDGTKSALVLNPDPRFGMQAPMAQSSVATPSGLTSKVTETRSANLSDPANPWSFTKATNTVDVNGHAFTGEYVRATKTFTSRTPMGRQSTSTLDDKGHLIKSEPPEQDPIAHEYDDRGRLVRVRQGTRTSSLTYDNNGWLMSITDALGHTQRLEHDIVGQLKKQTLTDGRVIDFTYDIDGNMLSLKPPGRENHSFAYTNVNLLKEYAPPALSVGPTTTQYTYNLDQQILQTLQPKQPEPERIEHEYDSAGRLSKLKFSGKFIAFGYDATSGNATSIEGPYGVKLAYTYDGSLVTKTEWLNAVSGSVERTYNKDFALSSETIKGGSAVAFTYDDDGLLTQAGDFKLFRSALSGRLDKTALEKVTDSFQYNSFGEVTQYQASHDGKEHYKVEFTHDALGRITKKEETVLGTKSTSLYSYDLAGRLVNVEKDGATSSYMYDSNGNRTKYTSRGKDTTATYDAHDRLTEYGTTTYLYSLMGRLESKDDAGKKTEYTYDALGNLTQVLLPDGTKIEYIVDANGRRVGRKVGGTLKQVFLYQGSLRPVAELDGSGNIVARFVYATKTNVPEYMVKGGLTYRIVTDHLGSPRLLIEVVSGTVAQKMEYDEFGNVLVDTNPGFQPFGFAGGLYDADTKLVRFGARDYDAQTGRWTAKDPIGFDGGDANLYGYVGGDSVNFIDPSGQAGNAFRFILKWGPTVAGPLVGVLSKRFLSMYNEAARDAQSKFPDNKDWSKGDAYRHCLAACMFQREYGEYATKVLGWANEKKGDWLPPHQESGEKARDYYNNAYGRSCGKKAKSTSDCQKQCMGGLGNGGLDYSYVHGSTKAYEFTPSGSLDYGGSSSVLYQQGMP